MSEIISNPHDLVETIEKAGYLPREQLVPFLRFLHRTVMSSFGQDTILVPTVTGAEYRRRAQICIDWFRILRLDYKWSLERTRDHLALALRKTLDGHDWDPGSADERACWSPDALGIGADPSQVN